MSHKPDIRRIHTLDDPAVLALVSKSDDYLSSLYPPESNHAEPLDALVGQTSAFFACYVDARPAACGAVKLFESETAYGEIKRVFVDKAYRGKRLAITIMNHLEEHLVSKGIELARLEAGPRQPEALSLYRKLGYRKRGPFGAYQPDPLRVFMEKSLAR